MFCSRTSNIVINKLHERALRVVLGDDLSYFEPLFQNNNDIYSHHKNLQSLMIEVFKIKNELAPPIMNLITPAIFQSVWHKGKELCIMVLRQKVIGIHNYGLSCQKTLRKLSNSKFLRGK